MRTMCIIIVIILALLGAVASIGYFYVKYAQRAKVTYGDSQHDPVEQERLVDEDGAGDGDEAGNDV